MAVVLRTPAVGHDRRERSRSPPHIVNNHDKDPQLDAVITCSSVLDWLKPECDAFRGMVVPRSQTWDHAQHFLDRLYSRVVNFGVVDESESLMEIVPLFDGASESKLGVQLDAAAQRLLSPLVQHGLPADLAAQIRMDVAEAGPVVARLLPNAAELMLKLELTRENICGRWHMDNYVGRAIVSYNCAATVHVHDDFVDFERFEIDRTDICRGPNEYVIRARKAIRSAGVGNILFIKGMLFPSRVNGLVHEAPDKLHRHDCSVATRLILKADEWAAQGTTLFITVDRAVGGMMLLEDTVRGDARAAVAQLKALGVQPALLTGDNEEAGRRAAAAAGIETVHARGRAGHL
ncbi:unnamed protein product [Prorocentrum cordatum]|uniref:Uncharacterized protein n=1 Tax=Prorocentrum cordatum TaxID=2364126 RepID=A0ABN9TF64_9DINO|nr:unnamed protein product [Polarella glacialis]